MHASVQCSRLDLGMPLIALPHKERQPSHSLEGCMVILSVLGSETAREEKLASSRRVGGGWKKIVSIADFSSAVERTKA